MIASVHGTVTAIALDHAVIEVGGIGLAIRAAPSTLAGLHRGKPARLATTLVVREDSLTLFGFASDAAKELFELVQSVSGVGPKIALALIAVLEPDELGRALASGDYATLTRAPGIGRKGAERLVLELRDKVGIVTAGAGLSDPVAPVAWRPKLSDALIGLGFTGKQADDAITTLASDTEDPAVAGGDVGLLLRRALGLLGRHR